MITTYKNRHFKRLTNFNTLATRFSNHKTKWCQWAFFCLHALFTNN